LAGFNPYFERLPMPATSLIDASHVEGSPIDARHRREFVSVISIAADLFTRFATDHQLDLPLAWEVVDHHQRHLDEDFHAMVALAVQPLYDSYPVRHSVQTSLLSMAMGMDAGFPEDELRTIGLGSLVHDVGMLLVPSRLLGVETITERDRLDLMRHPLHAAVALDAHAGVSPAARCVAAQIHERLDGSGYPHGLKGSSIHRLARYAAVADAFLGMISPRPHRQAGEPYRAVEEILFAAHRGRFDSAAVRTLLRVVSLYPIGSCVWLNDGRVGRVVRSNPEAVDRPVIVAMDLDHDVPKLETVDLSEQPLLSVVKIGELTGNSAPASAPVPT
jgi:HD-GYP domain-containing protein (c-di-GMP phosphodiesterase class II)